jgi:RimJ/RimL family protein N-acetyltransferase
MLTDGIIRLAPLELADAPLVMAWDADPEIQRWFDWPVGAAGDLDGAERTVRDKQARWASGAELTFAIRAVAGGTGLGWIDLQPRPGGAGNVAYGVLSAFRRRGVAARAVALASRHAFAALGWDPLEIRVAADNLASRAVAERAGFRLDELLLGAGLYEKHQPLLGRRFDWAVYRRSATMPP